MQGWVDGWRVAAGALLCASLIAAGPGARAAAPRAASDVQLEVDALIHAGTADSLAAASLLDHLAPRPDDDSTDDAAANAEGPGAQPGQLIQRAVALAPDRPELVWLELRDCEQRRCPEVRQLADRLKALDPQNGFAWLPDLRALPSQSTPEATQIIERMGAASRPRLYWNALAAAMFDALTHHERAPPPTSITRGADDRLLHVTGLLAAVDVPAVAPLARACRLDQFDLPGRQAACESLMKRLASSDAVIAQNLSVSLQESWWPAGGAEHEALRREHLQQRYLTVASNRFRRLHADRDAEIRVDYMRHLPREADVELAMLRAFHEPLERPAAWREPTVAP